MTFNQGFRYTGSTGTAKDDLGKPTQKLPSNQDIRASVFAVSGSPVEPVSV